MIRRELWTANEVEAFLTAAADTRLEAAWHLLATTQMRVAEVLALRWADVDATIGRIYVRNAVAGVSYAEIAVPRGVVGTRAIDVVLVLDVLARHRSRQDAERSEWGACYCDADLVICRESGQPQHPRELHRAFEQVVADTCLPTIRLTDLRRIDLRAPRQERIRS